MIDSKTYMYIYLLVPSCSMAGSNNYYIVRPALMVSGGRGLGRRLLMDNAGKVNGGVQAEQHLVPRTKLNITVI